MSIINYAARIGACSVLGPGKRAVVWVYGCCFSCEGCIAENFKRGKANSTTDVDLANWYLQQNADGLTISGGEPMLQAGPLADVMDLIKERTDCGLIVYTGFVYEELLKQAERDSSISRFLSHIDLLVDGPYIQEKDFNQPYKGSENQRFLLLTDRYHSELDSYYNKEKSRQIEIHLSAEYTLMTGVPDKAQASIWRQIKKIGEQYESNTLDS